MNLRTALMAATMLAVPALAQAQTASGVYIGAGAGANWRDQIIERGANGTRLSIGSQTGFVGVGSLGYAFRNGFRIEAEGNYRSNPIGTTTVTLPNGTAFASTSGRMSYYGAMANALYDFNLAALGVPNISPYIGAGIGYGVADVSRITGRTNPGALLTTANVSGNNGSFAYQAIAGVSFGLGQYVPGLALTLEYRYYATTTTELKLTTTTGTTVSRTNYTPNNTNQSALLGLRYTFGVTPPPPPPVAVPAPVAQQVARTYLVFFDWNRADLTDRARQIIAEAAAARSSVRSTRIEVSGHADRSGPDAYNQALSMRRAEAVASELGRRGVPRSEMSIQAFGESRPLVPTADGVREPQNRRVEIVLR
jgi:outer membrane protein OmpA-like peptidoglycan-associated protein